MSGIYIKGVQMPERCDQCRFCRTFWDGRRALCNANGKILRDKMDEKQWGELEIDKPDWCPIIAVPDHGDLIDKTDLMVSLADWQLSEAPEEGINWDSGRNVTSHELQYSIYRLLGDVYEEVRDEPVIIPADKEEE